MAKKFGDKTISEWAREWGVSRQAASHCFKTHSDLTIEEILELRKTETRGGKPGRSGRKPSTDINSMHKGAIYKKIKNKVDPDKEKTVSKWVRVSGKQAKEWAEIWGVTPTAATHRLREIYGIEAEEDVKSFAKKLDKLANRAILIK